LIKKFLADTSGEEFSPARSNLHYALLISAIAVLVTISTVIVRRRKLS